MPENLGVTNVSEIRGKDGFVTYEVTGGKRGEGEARFLMPREVLHNYEKEHGKQGLNDMLKRQIETSLESRKERFDNI